MLSLLPWCRLNQVAPILLLWPNEPSALPERKEWTTKLSMRWQNVLTRWAFYVSEIIIIPLPNENYITFSIKTKTKNRIDLISTKETGLTNMSKQDKICNIIQDMVLYWLLLKEQVLFSWFSSAWFDRLLAYTSYKNKPNLKTTVQCWQ